MSNFKAARSNMVDGQIQPNGITNHNILDVFEATPREIFAPKSLQNVAYADENLRIAPDRFLLNPTTHAKMVQALDPQNTDVVLDIGGATGYSAAILSPLVSTVIALETQDAYAEEASRNWREIGAANIVAVQGSLSGGYATNAPYNLIFMGGAVAELPTQIIDQLEEGGRLITILKTTEVAVGEVVVVEKLAGGQFSTHILCEASAPYIKGFEPKADFTF